MNRGRLSDPTAPVRGTVPWAWPKSSCPEAVSSTLRGALFEPANHQIAGAQDVSDHPLPRSLGFARLDRLEHRRVLRDVLLEQVRALTEDDPGQIAREALVQVGQRRGETLVSGRFLDDEVEQVVALDPLRVGPRRRGAVARLLPAAQPVPR